MASLPLLDQLISNLNSILTCLCRYLNSLAGTGGYGVNLLGAGKEDACGGTGRDSYSNGEGQVRDRFLQYSEV